MNRIEVTATLILFVALLSVIYLADYLMGLWEKRRVKPIKDPPPGFDSVGEWKEFKRRYKESHGYPEETDRK